MSGERRLKYSLRWCKNHDLSSKEPISIINRICPPDRTFDSKVMATVGILRWFLNLQREEIQLLFYARGTDISTGEISALSEEFLLRFYICHKKHNFRMKSLFTENGGTILHLDGTGEAGDEIVFTAEEGITHIKIDAQIIPSESKDYIKPFLRVLKNSIGTPIAIIRDMSKNIKDAASEIFPNTQQLICHYHFVSNLGKHIFKDEYEAFRKTIVKTRILGELVSLKEKAVEIDSFHNIIAKAEYKWAAIAIEYMLWPREQPSGFPFILPYFEIMNRVIEIKNFVKKIIEWNAEQNLAVKIILDLFENVEKLTQAADIKTHYFRIEKCWKWYMEMRKILEVHRHLKDEGCHDNPKLSVNIKNGLNDLISKIKSEIDKKDKEIGNISKIIIDECTDHWEELTAEIKDHKGNEVKIVRHNGIVENSHRWSRMHTRRRTGRSRTTNDMGKYGALTAILSNLENEIYVKEVLGDVNDFVYELASIAEDELEVARNLIKPYHNDFLVSSDAKRLNLLHEFVTILEHSDKKNEVNVEKWLLNVEKANPLLTP